MRIVLPRIDRPASISKLGLEAQRASVERFDEAALKEFEQRKSIIPAFARW